MASITNITLKPFRGAFDSGMAIMAGRWAIGGTGAVGAKTAGVGLTLTRDDVGLYTVQLTANGADASAPAIVFADAQVVNDDSDPSNDTGAIAGRVLTSVASTGVITLTTYDEAGVARDPASGAALCVFVLVKLSGVP